MDGAGSAYVAGLTSSANFPTRGAAQASYAGAVDAFAVKLSPSGNALVYSTYLGGSGEDNAVGVALDAAGSAYVAGWTYSTDLPTVSPFQAALRGTQDAFVLKLSPTGNALVYSTYLGGGRTEISTGIAVDGAGSAYVTGWTESTNFPRRRAYQNMYGGGTWDGFVTKLSPNGSALAYSTYLGGADFDSCNAIAVDGAGAAFVTGSTSSTGFPTQNPFQATLAGRSDGFVTRLSPAGDTLAYSTFLGGSLVDTATGIALDSTGHAYVVGNTGSSNFPLWTPFQAVRVGTPQDGFVTKLAPTGNALVYSSYLGGSLVDLPAGVAVDSRGHAYVHGYGLSLNFPTQNPLQALNAGGLDTFVTKVVVRPLVLAPPSATVVPRGTVTFAASGGSETGYVYTLATNASGGSIGGGSGVYVAGAIPDVTDVVQVTDSLGETDTSDVMVTGAQTDAGAPDAPDASAQDASAQDASDAATRDASGGDSGIADASPGPDSGAAPGDATPDDASVDGPPGTGSSDCGCRTTGAPPRSGAALLALLAVAGFAAARRRARAPSAPAGPAAQGFQAGEREAHPP